MNESRNLGLLALMFLLLAIGSFWQHNNNLEKVLHQPEFRQVEDLVIEIPALARPDLATIQEEYPWIDRIEQDTSPTESVTLILGTVLRESEGGIDGEEYQRRIRDVPVLGYQQLEWLVGHQDEPAFKALLGQLYVDGPAIVVARCSGHQYFPYLRQCDERWCLGWGDTDFGLYQHGRVASAHE